MKFLYLLGPTFEDTVFISSIDLETTFITPCIALLPYLALAGPLMTSRLEAISVCVSKSPFTLQNPLGLTGIPSSSIKKDPHAPGPVRTGDLIEVRCSCPDPLLIQIPGILLNTCFGC